MIKGQAVAAVTQSSVPPVTRRKRGELSVDSDVSLQRSQRRLATQLAATDAATGHSAPSGVSSSRRSGRRGRRRSRRRASAAGPAPLNLLEPHPRRCKTPFERWAGCTRTSWRLRRGPRGPEHLAIGRATSGLHARDAVAGTTARQPANRQEQHLAQRNRAVGRLGGHALSGRVARSMQGRPAGRRLGMGVRTRQVPTACLRGQRDDPGCANLQACEPLRGHGAPWRVRQRWQRPA